MNSKLNNINLWTLAEIGKLEIGDTFVNQDETYIIFIDNTFKPYYTEDDIFTTLRVGDVWMYVRNEYKC